MYETNVKHTSTFNEVILQALINQRNTNSKKEAVGFQICKKENMSDPNFHAQSPSKF